MGIFFFIRFFFCARGPKNDLSFGNSTHRYLFFKNESSRKLVRLNFFKKKLGLKIFFRKKNLLEIIECVLPLYGTPCKVKFFFISLVLSFLSAGFFFNFFSFFLPKKLKIGELLVIILQVLVVAVIKFRNSNFFFLNFYKFSDFFFFIKRVLTPAVHRSYTIKNFFVRNIAVFYSRAAEGSLSSKIKKYNFSTSEVKNPVVVVNDLPKYLFLINSFFSKDKKFFFLRNNEIYNKSRYSRNRQTYRTGVFWCI